MPKSVTYKTAKTCACGYSTFNYGNWSVHKRLCGSGDLAKVNDGKDSLLSQMKEQLATKDQQMKEQLEAKDEQMKQQLAAKDEQIKEKDRQIDQLIKRPRTVNNNTTNKYVVEQHVNVFGKECISHISPEEIQALLADPVNAVPQFIKLKHRRAPGGVNKNVRIPNQKRAMYQVVSRGEDGEKEWEIKAKGDVLEELYDENSGHLEAEADEDTRVGSRFLNHQEKIKDSASGVDGGRKYKEQLDKIHCVISM